MKIKYRMAAIVSAVALTGTAILAGASAASAVTDGPICNTGAADCALSQGSGYPLLYSSTAQTNFATKNAETTNGHEYVEFYQVGTNACITDSGANVYLQTCSAGDSRELWYYDAGVPEFINLYATNHYGHNDCMESSAPEFFIVASCATGGSSRTWWWDN